MDLLVWLPRNQGRLNSMYFKQWKRAVCSQKCRGAHWEGPQITCNWEEAGDAKKKKKIRQIRAMKAPKNVQVSTERGLRLVACNIEEAWGAHGSVLYSYAIYRAMAQPSLLHSALHCCCWLLVGQFRALEGRQPGNGSTLSSSTSPISSSSPSPIWPSATYQSSPSPSTKNESKSEKKVLGKFPHRHTSAVLWEPPSWQHHVSSNV